MIRVLFVCMGNICRSPMAEAVFTDQVKKAGLSHLFDIDSAGTIGYHAGEPTHPGTQKILSRHSISYNGRARKITLADLAKFDYLIGMDTENILDLKDMNRGGANAPKVHMLLDFARHATVRDVPDPYYTGNFEYVYQLVLDGCQGLLNYIRTEHNI